MYVSKIICICGLSIETFFLSAPEMQQFFQCLAGIKPRSEPVLQTAKSRKDLTPTDKEDNLDINEAASESAADSNEVSASTG